LAHREVAEDEHVGPYQLAQSAVPGAVRVAAGQVRENPAGLGEADVRALPDRQVPEGLCDVGLSDTDRPEQNDGLAGV
jgi:hypothetical protein